MFGNPNYTGVLAEFFEQHWDAAERCGRTMRVDQPLHQARCTSRAAMMALIDSGIGTGRWVCWLV